MVMDNGTLQMAVNTNQLSITQNVIKGWGEVGRPLVTGT